MIYRTDRQYVQGSNALDMSAGIALEQHRCGNIIDLSDIKQNCAHTEYDARDASDDACESTVLVEQSAEQSFRSQLRNHLRDIADSSDMICSLRFEDVRGISFDPTSKRDTALFSAASIAIAIICIVVGA